MNFRQGTLSFALVATLALVAALPTSVRAQEIVVNGGFESGAFAPGWTVVDPSDNSNVGGDNLFSHSGDFHANLGATPNLGTLTQNLVTTPNQNYTLSFWLANDGSANPGAGILNEFDVLWNGSPVFTESNVAITNYTHFTFSVTATSASTPLVFNYRNDDDFFRLDDVSVTAAVPEPSIAWLALTGLPLLALARRRASSSR